MSIVEVLQPDGSIHVYTSEQGSASAIAQEVDELYPDATLWRMSNEWHSVTDGKQAVASSSVWALAQTVAIILALAIILIPVVTWVLSTNGVNVPAFSQLRLKAAATRVEADEVDSPQAQATGSVSQDVHILGVAEQTSDTTRTLRIQLRNDGNAPHADVRVRVIFHDILGATILEEESHIGVITLDAGEEGYVKVWAHSDYGVGNYQLEILAAEDD